MEKCKVYRGLDTPCKIKGVYSRYFYIVFVVGMMTVMLVFTSVSSALRGGTFSSLIIEVIFELMIPIGIYGFFYKLSNRPKIKSDMKVSTVSNRWLYKTLQKRPHG